MCCTAIPPSSSVSVTTTSKVPACVVDVRGEEGPPARPGRGDVDLGGRAVAPVHDGAVAVEPAHVGERGVDLGHATGKGVAVAEREARREVLDVHDHLVRAVPPVPSVTVSSKT